MAVDPEEETNECDQASVGIIIFSCERIANRWMLDHGNVGSAGQPKGHQTSLSSSSHLPTSYHLLLK
jgi:hypothetical protein